MAGSYSEELLGAQPMPQGGPRREPDAPRGYADELLIQPMPEPEARIEPTTDFSRDASLFSQAVASIANDPMYRAKYYAKKRGIPEDRYRVIGSRVAYQGDDDQWYWEEPPLELSAQGIAANLAQGVGPSISVVPPTAAGIISAPMMMAGPAGLAGSMAVTGATAAASQRARDFLAEGILDQPVNDWRAAENAAIEATAQGVSRGVGALLERNVARDIAQIDRPRAESLGGGAQRQGIQLTPAEATNLPSLKAQQKVLGNTPGSAEWLQDFYERRAETQIAPAVERYLARLSPQDSAEMAGTAIRGAARESMERVAQNRAAQASPIYERAFQDAAPVDVAPVIQQIDNWLRVSPEGGQQSRVLEKVRGFLMRGDAPQSALDALHAAKIEIDDLINAREVDGSSVSNTVRGRLTSIKNALLRQMDATNPDYASARAVFADLSPGVNRVREGIVGVIADLPDTQLQKAAAKLFSPTNLGPQAASEARRMLGEASPEAWQAIKRAYLEDVWLRSQKETLGGGPRISAGGMWRKALLGDPKQRAILQATLEPQEFAALNSLGEVLDAASRVKPIGSDTAYNQEVIKAMKDESLGALRLLRLASTDIGSNLADAIANWRMRGNAEELARIITSPDGMQQLRQLRRLSPRDWQAIAAGTRAATVGGRAAMPENDAPRPIR